MTRMVEIAFIFFCFFITCGMLVLITFSAFLATAKVLKEHVKEVIIYYFVVRKQIGNGVVPEVKKESSSVN